MQLVDGAENNDQQNEKNENECCSAAISTDMTATYASIASIATNVCHTGNLP